MTAGFLTSNGSESVLGVATVDGLFWQAGQVAKKSCPGDFVVSFKTMIAGFSRVMVRRVLWVSRLWMVFFGRQVKLQRGYVRAISWSP